MKYHIVEEDGFCLIKVSGETRKNEAVIARDGLSPYLKEKGIKVIMDMKELGRFEPGTLVGVLNGIRKEVNLLRGDLKLYSYLIRGDYKNVLIDSGVDRNFSRLQKSLLTLRLKVMDIDIVINTHLIWETTALKLCIPLDILPVRSASMN